MDDIKVIDLSQNYAGPTCTQILADLGARVIKVEPPGGDAARAWGPPFWGEDSALFMAANRGKHSVAIDLKAREGRDVVMRMIDSADVFVQAFRAGVVERLGIDFETLHARNPALIYVTVSAFGTEGPRRSQPGYDPLMQAYSGLMSMTGHEGSPPARAGASVIDATTGMWAGLSVMAALRERDRSGMGSHVVASLLDSALNLVSYKLTGYLANGVVPGPMGSAFGSIAPYEAFPTADGTIMIAAANDAIFERLCAALERPELTVQPIYATNPERVRNRASLVVEISNTTTTLEGAELMSRLEAHAVPHAPIHDVSQLPEDPQILASGMLRAPGGHADPTYRDVTFPVRFDGERPSADAVPPTLGRDTDEVLRDYGYSDAEVRALRASGAVS